MEDTELKYKFDHIQGIFNRCINHAYCSLTDGIYIKSEYLNTEQIEELERQEYLRATDELTQLYMRYSVLREIQHFYSAPEFLWDSSFYEAMEPDEKRKYLSFSIASFDYSRYEQDNTVYDRELPYFSVVVKAVLLERYSAYLQKKKKGVQPELRVQQQSSKAEETPIATPPEKATPPIAKTENPFESVLNDEQVALLATCINEVKMFNVSVTAGELAAIFACKPKSILRSNNNRLIAFLFSGLSDRCLITPNWQSVIANNKLFLSKDTKRDKYINQSDLSTATNYIRDIAPERKYVTIDKYLKQLKKL